MELVIKTSKGLEVIDITKQVSEQVKPDSSLLHVFVAHTTCAVTTADLDPGAGEDLVAAVWEMIPDLDYARHHDPKHFPAHIAHSVIGPSLLVPVENGGLVLGTGQRLVLIELDGPRDRKIVVSGL